MRTKLILPMLLMTAVTFTFGVHEATAAISAQISTPNVSISINDYMPAPAGVYVLYDAGRPYYVEREQRVYMVERPKHKKHHKKHGHKHDHD